MSLWKAILVGYLVASAFLIWFLSRSRRAHH
jgi:hypothetical protein